MEKLTNRQKSVLEYITRKTQENQLPPTVREIGEHFQISSTNGVRSILAALIKKGYIRRTPKVSRGIELLSEKIAPPQQSTENNTIPTDFGNSAEEQTAMEIPIVGRIAAGQPILAVQNLEGTVTVDRDFLANQQNVFALRVRGDSMIEAGIHDGDLIFARQQNTAETGQIVVAILNDEATVKYFRNQNSEIWLDPANPVYQPIPVSEDSNFSISGRVIGVMRKIS